MTFSGKIIRIVDIDGNVFEWQVTDYVYPDDGTGLESIIIDCTKGTLAGKSAAFWERDIRSIKIINAEPE